MAKIPGGPFKNALTPKRADPLEPITVDSSGANIRPGDAIGQLADINKFARKSRNDAVRRSAEGLTPLNKGKANAEIKKQKADQKKLSDDRVRDRKKNEADQAAADKKRQQDAKKFAADRARMGGTLREGGGAGAGAGAGAGGAGGVAPVGAGGFPKGGMLGVLLNIDKNIAKLLECCRAGGGGGGAGAGAPNALARADIVKEKQDRLLAAEQQRSAEKLKQIEESKAKVAEKANKEFNQAKGIDPTDDSPAVRRKKRGLLKGAASGRLNQEKAFELAQSRAEKTRAIDERRIAQGKKARFGIDPATGKPTGDT